MESLSSVQHPNIRLISEISAHVFSVPCVSCHCLFSSILHFILLGQDIKMTLLHCLFLDYATSSAFAVYVQFPKNVSPIALNAPHFLFPLLSPYFYPRRITASFLVTIDSPKGPLRCALFSCPGFGVTVPLLGSAPGLGYCWSRSALCVASDLDGLPTGLDTSDVNLLLEHLSEYVLLQNFLFSF